VSALDEDRRHLQAVLLALRDRLHRVDQRADEVRAEFEGAVVDAALAIAAAVLDRELAQDRDHGADAIRRALAAVPNQAGAATVRLHPVDAAHLGPIGDIAPGTTLTTVPDPEVARGGCVLQLGPTTVDASIAAALERVREVLCG
jgi:flagellar assembly protein FliH